MNLLLVVMVGLQINPISYPKLDIPKSIQLKSDITMEKIGIQKPSILEKFNKNRSIEVSA